MFLLTGAPWLLVLLSLDFLASAACARPPIVYILLPPFALGVHMCLFGARVRRWERETFVFVCVCARTYVFSMLTTCRHTDACLDKCIRHKMQHTDADTCRQVAVYAVCTAVYMY